METALLPKQHLPKVVAVAAVIVVGAAKNALYCD